MKINEIFSAIHKGDKNLYYKQIKRELKYDCPVVGIKYLFTKNEESRYYFLYVNGSEGKNVMLFREERAIEAGVYTKKTRVSVKSKV